MDARFSQAVNAIKSGDLDALSRLLENDPSLATARSSCGHPNLLQFIAVDGAGFPNQVEAISVLIGAGADIDSALVAAASVDNVGAAKALLDAGAAVDGTGGWSPLEESLYWKNDAVTVLLLARGASVRNLRCAAALGRVDLIPNYFNADGSLKPDAGVIDWPFGDPHSSERPARVKQELMAKVDAWSRSPQAVLNNAFVFACIHDRVEAAALLLDRGAEINAFPEGFDYDGSGLHYAAMNGHGEMVDFLLANGADATRQDRRVGSTPAGWADYGGHPELSRRLSNIEAA